MTGERVEMMVIIKKIFLKNTLPGCFFFKGEFALFSFQLSDLCRLVFGGDSAVFFFGLFFFYFLFFFNRRAE